jgi:hypothetical protein
MTRDELQAKLTAKGVDAALYSLGEIASESESYSVVPGDSGWRVLYKERGQLSELVAGLTETAAYDWLYSEFRRMFGWSA